MADRTPPELFERLLWHLNGSPRSETTTNQRLVLSKRELSTCCLTCKYWAAHLRRRIFVTVTIRSREDWVTFVHFATSTVFKPSIGVYVEYLTLQQTVPSEPWIHIPLICMPNGLTPSLYRLHVETKGISSGEERDLNPLTLRSVYQDIPGRFPPLSAQICNFYLTNIHFRSFEGIMATVDSADCKVVHCKELLWSDKSALTQLYSPVAFGKVRRWKTSAKEVHIHQCPAYWPFLWILVTTRPRHLHVKQKPLFVQPTELQRILSLLQFVCDDCSCSFCAAKKLEANVSYAIHGRRWPSPDDGEIIIQAPNADTESGCAHALRLTLQQAGLVAEIELSMYNDPKFDFSDPRSINIDWSSLDEYAAGFGPTLQRFSILGHDVTETGMKSFMPFVHERMTQLQSAGKLELFYIKEDDGVRVAWPADTNDGADSEEAGST